MPALPITFLDAMKQAITLPNSTFELKTQNYYYLTQYK
jgi:hypothetical protein